MVNAIKHFALKKKLFQTFFLLLNKNLTSFVLSLTPVNRITQNQEKKPFFCSSLEMSSLLSFHRSTYVRRVPLPALCFSLSLHKICGRFIEHKTLSK
jgi:hypothetical protein